MELEEFGAQKVDTTVNAGGNLLSFISTAVEGCTAFDSRTSRYRSETSSSKLQGAPLEDAATVKLQAVANELLPQDSFVIRRQKPRESAAIDGAALQDVADESVGQFSDEFCAKVMFSLYQIK